MLTAYTRLVRRCLLPGLLLPVVTSVCSRFAATATDYEGFWTEIFVTTAVSASFMVGIAALLGRWMLRMETQLDDLAAQQVSFLDGLSGGWATTAIVASAAASLFLELAIIRWQGCVWEIFALYKNFGLFSCFAGLGLGYALAKRDRIPLVFTIPLLTFQMLLFIGLRNGLASWQIQSLVVMPVREQLTMGLSIASHPADLVAIYYFLAVTMLLTALAFVPVGQLCGRLMERSRPLRSYGLNLAGSILGVAFMLGVSFLWTPPIVWFAPCFAVLLAFLAFDRKAMLAGGLASLAALTVLAWPVSFSWERIYSPYQLLERGPGPDGLSMIRAAGHYYQRLNDLSAGSVAAYPEREKLADYYELPFRIAGRLGRVAVVGAGTGNDVAAALRSGSLEVDAIEIDPAIMRLGILYHPERPYADRRVHRFETDARTFLRSTSSRYDLIVYGLLDSHTLLSQASSVRLDSFVYTVEGIRDARNRLNDDGVVSLSFSVLSDEIGRKIYLMMTQAFDGHPPICIHAEYDGSVVFVQNKRGNLQVDAALIESAGFTDRSRRYANPAILADVSTDDWPFFYMPRRIYPVSYVGIVLLVLAVSLFLFRRLLSERPKLDDAPFFFLGAGFMLVETKGITELGLTFGNTWQVIGIVIAAILTMAFLANLAVDRLGLRKPQVAYLLLLASLGFGLYRASHGGFEATRLGQVSALIVLTLPLLFSGIVFSTLLSGTKAVSSAIAMNLLGAMAGGLLEYNSMYFGFRSLYWIAVALYAAAMLTSFRGRGRGVASRSDGDPEAPQEVSPTHAGSTLRTTAS